MTIAVQVSNIVVRTSFGYTHRSADFELECQSRIATDEKVYEGRAAGEKAWGFDFYWDELYGQATPPMSATS